MIGANGPRLLKITAEYADTWSTFGGMKVRSFSEMLTLTRQRNTLLDSYCAELGRDPSTLRRSVFIFTQEEYQRLYTTPGEFEHIVRHYIDIGITEIMFLYPFVPTLMPMFEHIVYEAIPQLRNEYKISSQHEPESTRHEEIS